MYVLRDRENFPWTAANLRSLGGYVLWLALPPSFRPPSALFISRILARVMSSSANKYIASNQRAFKKQTAKLQKLDAQYLVAAKTLQTFLDNPKAYYREARPMVC